MVRLSTKDYCNSWHMQTTFNDGMEEESTELQNTGAQIGLMINAKKTKYICTRKRREEEIGSKIDLGEYNLKNVEASEI